VLLTVYTLACLIRFYSASQLTPSRVTLGQVVFSTHYLVATCQSASLPVNLSTWHCRLAPAHLAC
jgi:hypothetical protein